jgi:hypothetical protein
VQLVNRRGQANKKQTDVYTDKQTDVYTDKKASKNRKRDKKTKNTLKINFKLSFVI